LKSADTPAVILLSEHSRRMREMSRMLGGRDENMFPMEETLVINGNNKLIKALLGLSKDKKEDTEMICRHIYDLAVLSHKQMSTDAMNGFIMRSNETLLKICS
jgi:molecular chaperone HtpG